MRRTWAWAGVLTVAASAVGATAISKTPLDFADTDWSVPAAKVTIKLKIVKGGSGSGPGSVDLQFFGDGTYSGIVGGELYEWGSYLHPTAFSKKAFTLPVPDAVTNMLQSEEAGLESEAVLEGLDLDFAFAGMSDYSTRITAKLIPKSGIAVGKLKYGYKANGVVSGSGLSNHPFSYKVKATGLSDPVPLSDILAD